MNDVFLDEIVRPDEPTSGPSPRSARRAERAERDRRRRRRRRRNLTALVISLAVLGGIGYAVVQYVLPVVSGFQADRQETTDYPGPGHGSVDVSIPEGATGTAMGEVLVEAGVVKSVGAFTDAFSGNPDAGSIQPGTYGLLLEMKASDVVLALLDSENRVQTKVTIPEGLRVDQILEKVSSVTTVPVADLQAAMADTAATGLPAEAGGSYEGWLYAATYGFEPGATPTQMISAMVSETVKQLEALGVPEGSRQTLLTKASLVEREAKSPEDRAKVARAIENRLAQDMILQIDASVAYGAGKSGTELTREDLQTDTPYNTYTRTGLPPTPIASPSLVSMEAVLHPADGPWLFWVTVNLDTGETRFAETNAEHEQNKALLREWEAQQESADG